MWSSELGVTSWAYLRVDKAQCNYSESSWTDDDTGLQDFVASSNTGCANELISEFVNADS